MKMLSFLGSFLAISANEDANTANCKDCTKCPNKGGKQIMKKCNNTYPKPSSDIRTSLKRKECQRETKTPVTEGNRPSNAIKPD